MNIQKIRAEFPILKKEINGKKLIYFDNGATTQKPRLVLDAINEFYTNKNANIHRGVHYLSQLATTEYEGARKNVQSYLNAKYLEEIIFT